MARPRRGSEPLQLAHFRVDAGDWAEFGAATSGDRAEVLRQYIAWYLRRRYVTLPQRPERKPDLDFPDASPVVQGGE
jgi:hypothetical protein